MKLRHSTHRHLHTPSDLPFTGVPGPAGREARAAGRHLPSGSRSSASWTKDEQLLAAVTAKAAPIEPVWGETPEVPPPAPPAPEPEPVPPPAGIKRRGGKRKVAEAAAAAAAAPSTSNSSSGNVAPMSPRVFGALQWRLEFKRVWRAMEGIVGEYVESLEVAAKAVEAGAAVGAGR